MLAVDIDHVEQVNDRHGRLAGDALLTLVAQRLLTTAREADTVAGVGGDGFVIVRLQTTAAAAAATATRVRDAVRGHALDLPAGGRRATISVGVAVARTTDGDMQDVLRRADEFAQ